jgi:hypothetical protein
LLTLAANGIKDYAERLLATTSDQSSASGLKPLA